MSIITRSQANLPPVPSSVGHRSLSSWAGIRIHHTGGPFSSWRSIHDWQTAGRPANERLVYIGYSFGIANGRVTELRGWDRHPAHDFINTHIGVVFGGSYGTSLPSSADLDALVWFIGEAKRRGVKTGISTHREVGQTTCPGDRLHRWVKDVLPGRLASPPPPPEEESALATISGTEAQVLDKIAKAVNAPTAGKGSTLELWGENAADLPTWVRRAANESKKANRHAAQLLTGQAELRGILAEAGGGDAEQVRQAIRDELIGIAETIGPVLADELRGELDQLPAEQIEQAVSRALSRTRLAVEPISAQE